MVNAFISRHRRRRRVARALRIAEVTVALAPVFTEVGTAAVRAYLRAWRGR